MARFSAWRAASRMVSVTVGWESGGEPCAESAKQRPAGARNTGQMWRRPFSHWKQRLQGIWVSTEIRSPTCQPATFFPTSTISPAVSFSELFKVLRIPHSLWKRIFHKLCPEDSDTFGALSSRVISSPMASAPSAMRSVARGPMMCMPRISPSSLPASVPSGSLPSPSHSSPSAATGQKPQEYRLPAPADDGWRQATVPCGFR